MAPGTRRRPRLRVRESKYNPLMGSHTVGIVCFVLGTALTARSLAEGTYEGSLVAAAGRWIRGVLNVSSTHLRRAAKWSWALVTRVVSRGVWRARRLWARLLRRPVPQRVVALGAAHMTAGVHESTTLSVSDPDLETQVRVLREQQGRTSERVRDSRERLGRMALRSRGRDAPTRHTSARVWPAWRGAALPRRLLPRIGHDGRSAAAEPASMRRERATGRRGRLATSPRATAPDSCSAAPL